MCRESNEPKMQLKENMWLMKNLMCSVILDNIFLVIPKCLLLLLLLLLLWIIIIIILNMIIIIIIASIIIIIIIYILLKGLNTRSYKVRN